MSIRRLLSDDAISLFEIISRRPEVNCYAASRTVDGLDRMAGTEWWGHFADERLHCALLVAGNAVPVEIENECVAAWANLLAQYRVASLVGSRTMVEPLSQKLSIHWPTPRLIRDHQPYMCLKSSVTGHVDRVQRLGPQHLESYIDASADMFTGEVGLDPMAHHAVGYVDRLSQNLESGFAYGWVADGEILFKVDVGAVTPTSCQIQGVWLIPRLRGQGLSVELMRQALILIQQDFHVTPCLYVNDFNAPALALYRKLGFETLDEFMTLFF